MKSSNPIPSLGERFGSMDKGASNSHIADLPSLFKSSKAVFVHFPNEYFLTYSSAIARNNKNRDQDIF